MCCSQLGDVTDVIAVAPGQTFTVQMLLKGGSYLWLTSSCKIISCSCSFRLPVLLWLHQPAGMFG